jgi:hypothetical protein
MDSVTGWQLQPGLIFADKARPVFALIKAKVNVNKAKVSGNKDQGKWKQRPRYVKTKSKVSLNKNKVSYTNTKVS